MAGAVNLPGSVNQEPSPVDLARKTIGGKQEAFSEIIRRYQAKIFGMALFYTRSPSSAEDLTQEIFIATYFSLGRYDPGRSFTNWILKIASNQCCKFVRKPASARLPIDEPSPFADPLEEQIDKERREIVITHFKRLQEDQRLVLWLFYFFERTYIQISEILDIPLHLVKIRLFRGKKALGEMLRKDPGLAREPAGKGVGEKSQM